jgi:hypothetical protein
LNFELNWRALKTFLQIYAETDEDGDPLDVSILPANEALILAALRFAGLAYEATKMAETSEVMKEAKALSAAEAESIFSARLALVGRA